MRHRVAWTILAVTCPLLSVACPQFQQDFVIAEDAGSNGDGVGGDVNTGAGDGGLDGEGGKDATPDAIPPDADGGTLEDVTIPADVTSPIDVWSGPEAAPFDAGPSDAASSLNFRCFSTSLGGYEACGGGGGWLIRYDFAADGGYESCTTANQASVGCVIGSRCEIQMEVNGFGTGTTYQGTCQ